MIEIKIIIIIIEIKIIMIIMIINNKQFRRQKLYSNMNKKQIK